MEGIHYSKHCLSDYYQHCCFLCCRVKAPTRKEPSLEVSEFHLSQFDKKRSQVKVTDLANVLKKRALHTEISQKLKTAQKRAKTLPKPLEKIHSDRVSIITKKFYPVPSHATQNI